MMNVSKLFVGCACVLGFLPSGISGLQLSIKMDHVMGWSSWFLAAGANQLMEMTNGTMSDTSSWDSSDTSDSLISSTPEEDPHWLFNLEFVAGILGALTSGWLCHYWKYKSRRDAGRAQQQRDRDAADGNGKIVEVNEKVAAANEKQNELQEKQIELFRNFIEMQEKQNALSEKQNQEHAKRSGESADSLEMLFDKLVKHQAAVANGNLERDNRLFEQIESVLNANSPVVIDINALTKQVRDSMDGEDSMQKATDLPSRDPSLSLSDYRVPKPVSLLDGATFPDNLPGMPQPDSMLPGMPQPERPVMPMSPLPEASILQGQQENQHRNASTPEVNPSAFDHDFRA